MKKILPYALFVLLCLATGFATSLMQRPDIETWYPFLLKTRHMPIPQTFGLVWTSLYFLIGCSMGRIHTNPKLKNSRKEWWIQWALCICWSIAFFKLHRPLWALGVALFLFVVILDYILITYKHDKPAALCFVPYLLWVAWSCYLNADIYLYN